MKARHQAVEREEAVAGHDELLAQAAREGVHIDDFAQPLDL